jgi:transcription elongation GreA/GreB family factor
VESTIPYEGDLVSRDARCLSQEERLRTGMNQDRDSRAIQKARELAISENAEYHAARTSRCIACRFENSRRYQPRG